MTYLVDIPRTVICLGDFSGLTSFLWVGGLVIVLLVISLRIFYLLEDLVAERL
jgi:lipopolysaccharide transport system permease protein